MFEYIMMDIKAAKKRDPAARNYLEIVLLYQGVHALVSYRIAHWFYIHKYYFIARYISQRSRKKTQIEIHPGARIGYGNFIDHGGGVVIGETSIIGNNCTIYQGVTLGATGKEKSKKRHPTIGNDVMIGAGAKILGNVKIGNKCRIAANAVVLHSFMDNLTLAGVPAKIVKKSGLCNN